MRFHRSPCHIELLGDFGIVTALQKQFDDLLFARSESNALLSHAIPLFPIGLRLDEARGCTFPFLIAPTMPL